MQNCFYFQHRQFWKQLLTLTIVLIEVCLKVLTKPRWNFKKDDLFIPYQS